MNLFIPSFLSKKELSFYKILRNKYHRAKVLPKRFRPLQGHSRQSWILDSTLWIADCLSVEVGFHIPIASMFLDSFNLIPDSKAHDSGSYDLKFATFQNHGETLRFHLNGNTIGFPQRRNFKFYSATNYLLMNKIFHGPEEFFSIVALKEHVRGITGVISVRIRGLFGGISTLITVA